MRRPEILTWQQNENGRGSDWALRRLRSQAKRMLKTLKVSERTCGLSVCRPRRGRCARPIALAVVETKTHGGGPGTTTRAPMMINNLKGFVKTPRREKGKVAMHSSNELESNGRVRFSQTTRLHQHIRILTHLSTWDNSH